jgi:hypothetical protein
MYVIYLIKITFFCCWSVTIFHNAVVFSIISVLLLENAKIECHQGEVSLIYFPSHKIFGENDITNNILEENFYTLKGTFEQI